VVVVAVEQEPTMVIAAVQVAVALVITTVQVGLELQIKAMQVVLVKFPTIAQVVVAVVRVRQEQMPQAEAVTVELVFNHLLLEQQLIMLVAVAVRQNYL
jgi:hypothetical protein